MKQILKKGLIWIFCAAFVCLSGVQTVYASEISEQSELAQQPETQAALTMYYDDRYSVQNDYPDYVIERIGGQFVTSYQVQSGQVSYAKDSDVLVKTSDTTLRATGTGAATVVLKKGSGWSAQYVNLHIDVKPARLTMIYLLGQSNMEGMCSWNTGYDNDENILNTAGTVYSTYLPTATNPSNYMTDIFWSEYGTSNNANKFVPQSLTSSTSLAGTELQYPLNTLTTEVLPNKGKGGMDSAIAYEWRQRTGDKVWIANLAYSGSRIYQWVPGDDTYERAVVTAQLMQQVYQAEITAGHYTTGNRLMFWMQGELDSLTSQAADYRQYFVNMYQNFTARVAVEKCGIITTRTAAYTHKYTDDVYFTGPRIAQYGLGTSPELPNVYVVCNVHEQWITDDAVAQYFKNRYPYGVFTYPMRDGAYSIPTCINDIHHDIHFSQIGHNENGIVAADNMYAVVYGTYESQRNFVWRDAEYQAVSQVTLRKNNNMVLVGILDPVYLSKQVSYVTSAGLSYDFRTGTLTAGDAVGDQYLDAWMSDGTLLARLTVHVVDHYDYEDASGRPYTGLYQQQDGQWIYVKNGSWAYDHTGFVVKDGDWWYVENGRITFTCNGLVKGLVNGNDTWWYVTGSRVNFCDTVASNAYGWWKITNGRVDFDFTGLAENAYGWWKITNGQVDFGYVGYEQNGSNWWYVYGGQVCFQTTDVLPGIVSGQYGWWKVCEGKVNFDDDVCENAYGWWKITTGKVDFQYTGLAQNACGWWMIQDGRVNFGSNGLVDNGNGWWLVKNGCVDFTYNGLVDNGNGWWLIANGRVDFNYQGYVQNEYGIWWVSNGQVQF
ncbi:sialate O-acetylesterase [uncultured Eubacterium sp.]|uniref:sialate O-acetylesterase n=1 Tax=uncultured Eubacterium sp. TaxID=165185 RepID=UPI0025E6ECEA|nr:sialate O-acetylesterase [uncultured Eubacterium sp.]